MVRNAYSAYSTRAVRIKDWAGYDAAVSQGEAELPGPFRFSLRLKNAYLLS